MAVDFLVNLAINFLQESPGSLIMGIAIVRSVYIFLFFNFSGIIIFNCTKYRAYIYPLIFTTIIVYLLIPLIIYLLKSNENSILQVYIDLHMDNYLFTVVCLPYLIASIVCIFIWLKFKIFNYSFFNAVKSDK